MRLNGKKLSLDHLCVEIKQAAFNKESTKSNATLANALFAEESTPYSRKSKNQGSNGGGMSSNIP